MSAIPHPEVLDPNWLPPVPIGRRRVLERVVNWLGDPYPNEPPPFAASVVGPPGSGTSTIAGLAARRVRDALRREQLGPPAALVNVPVGGLRGTHAIATAMLQSLDSGFNGRGFPNAQILAGFLHRLQRDEKPAIVVLDNIGPATPNLTSLVKALTDPQQFLPEGAGRAPPLWLILAGRKTGVQMGGRNGPVRFPVGHQISLEPLTATELEAIVRDRAERALGRTAPPELIDGIAACAMESGFGARRAVELLRRELLGPSLPALPRPRMLATNEGPVEPRVLWAIERAMVNGRAPVGLVRAWEGRYARLEGRPSLPVTTLWRRIVRLEGSGYLRREVRVGGPGGSQSFLEVLRPFHANPRPVIRNPRAGDLVGEPWPVSPGEEAVGAVRRTLPSPSMDATGDAPSLPATSN